jgi:hypothetical protein
MSFVLRTGIEVAKTRDPPHRQLVLMDEPKLNSVGNYAGDNFAEILWNETIKSYKLLYWGEDDFQIKAWLMVPFSDHIFVKPPNSDRLFDALHCDDEPIDYTTGLNWGKHWGIVGFMTPINEIKIGTHKITILDGNHKFIEVWRDKERKRLELAFVWAQAPIPRGRYHLELGVIDE